MSNYFESLVRRHGRFASRLEFKWHQYFSRQQWVRTVRYIGDKVHWADFAVNGVYIEIKPDDVHHEFVRDALKRCIGKAELMLIVEGTPGCHNIWLVEGNNATLQNAFVQRWTRTGQLLRGIPTLQEWVTKIERQCDG